MTAAWTAGTSTTCLTNRLAQLFGFSQVTVGAATGTSTPAFTFDSAASSVLIGNFAGSGGSSVTITGLSFGLTNHTLSANLMVDICNTAAWSSATSLLCLAGKTSAIWGDASITIAATVGTGSPVFTFDAAIITYATYNGPLSGSFFLQKRYTDTQFNGLHFGNINYTCTAVVESWLSAHTTSWVSATKLWLVHAPIYEIVQHSKLTVTALVGTGAIGFTYDAAIFAGVTPQNSVMSGGGSLTVTGLNFGNKDFSSTAGMELKNSDTTAWTSASTVIFRSSNFETYSQPPLQPSHRHGIILIIITIIVVVSSSYHHTITSSNLTVVH